MNRYVEAKPPLDPNETVVERVRPKIALVLPPGGAWGAAFFELINLLEKYGFSIDKNAKHPIDFLGGASIGALFGALYAKGDRDKFKTLLQLIDLQIMKDYIDPGIFRFGLPKGKRFEELLADLFGDMRVGDLPIDYTCLSTNILTGETIFSTRDDLLRDVLRMTCSVPIVLPAVKVARQTRLMNMRVIDGGFTNLIPIASVLPYEPDMIIAADIDRKDRYPFIQNRRQHRIEKQFAREGRVPEVIIPVRLSHGPQSFHKSTEMMDESGRDLEKWFTEGGSDLLFRQVELWRNSTPIIVPQL